MEPLNFNDLSGKVCAITGGTGVIGQELVRAMAAAGMKIAIIGRNKGKAQKVAEEISSQIPSKIIGVEADVLSREALVRARATIHEKLGRIEILINGAGGNSPEATTKVEQIDASNIDQLDDTFYGLNPEGFDQVFNLNFKGTLLPSMILTSDMVAAQKGVVLNISSMNSFNPLTKIPAYSAAKASVNNFTQWLAVHLAKIHIRVNAIAPGFFITEQNRFLVLDQEKGGYSPRGQKIVNNTPMGKFGTPSDLQGATLFLLSDLSGFITGTILPIDGGYSAFGGV